MQTELILPNLLPNRDTLGPVKPLDITIDNSNPDGDIRMLNALPLCTQYPFSYPQYEDQLQSLGDKVDQDGLVCTGE
jgi:hypothetical protein